MFSEFVIKIVMSFFRRNYYRDNDRIGIPVQKRACVNHFVVLIH